MQVWNLLHVARWKYRTQKSPKNRHWALSHKFVRLSSQLRHVSTFGKKLVKQQYLPHMFLQYGELRPSNGWDLLASLGHPSKFQRVSHLGSVIARHSSSGRQPNFAALNRGCHLYSAGRPPRWSFAHIVVIFDTNLWMSLVNVWRGQKSEEVSSSTSYLRATRGPWMRTEPESQCEVETGSCGQSWVLLVKMSVNFALTWNRVS